MSITPETVQEIVDQANETYEDKTIFSEDFTKPPDQRTQMEKCRKAPSIEDHALEEHLHSITIEKLVDGITDCEKTVFVNGLDEESTQFERVEEDFATSILKIVDGTPAAGHLYLPNQREYYAELERHGFADEIGTQYHVPVHWIQPDYLEENIGFLVDRGMYIQQKKQGGTSVISGNLDVGPVSKDNSQNRLNIHVRRVRGGKVEFEFWTEFTQPTTVEDPSVIHKLELPDLS